VRRRVRLSLERRWYAVEREADEMWESPEFEEVETSAEVTAYAGHWE
jgi:coenzyme PQQ precursor peptide PqqA